MSPTIIAQFFGGLAILSSIIIYSRKKRNSLLLFKAIQDILWAIHYLLLSCHSAAASSFICVSRSIVFYNSDKKLGKSRLWVALYIVFYIVSSVITWQNFYSILPSLASCTSTVAFYSRKTHKTKFLQIIASLITLTYTIFVSHSIAVYFGVFLTITTSAISLFQYYKEKKD